MKLNSRTVWSWPPRLFSALAGWMTLFLVAAQSGWPHEGAHGPSESSRQIAWEQWRLAGDDFAFEAQLVTCDDSNALLRLRDGHLLTVELQQLSASGRGARPEDGPVPNRMTSVSPAATVAAYTLPTHAGLRFEAGVVADDPEIAAHFKPFEQSGAIQVHRDNDYFYVESRGMPDHSMMVGITAWQQQVPLPQDYTGSNAWRIPLEPQPAAIPLSAKKGFFRGAIALAVNGVPVFNPIKNDGRTDTWLAGELDEFGGHCGRADDYHYHLPPVHLQSAVGAGKAIAYALDGYPVFGFQSEEEARLSKLDWLNGHHDESGNYHYHATKTYPYLNGGFFGTVMERGGQVDPQPRAEGVRPATPPLRGATITGFAADRDFHNVTVEYQYRNEKRSVSYQTTDHQRYRFTFDNGSAGTTTTSPSRRPQSPDSAGRIGAPRAAGIQEPEAQGAAAEIRQPWIVVHAAEMDLDSDDVITRSEMVGEAEKAFAGYDSDGDGRLGRSELAGTANSRSAMGGFIRGHAAEIDRDGDGLLTRQETVDNAARMFAKMDRNGDDRIDVAERDSARRTAAGTEIQSGPDAAADRPFSSQPRGRGGNQQQKAQNRRPGNRGSGRDNAPAQAGEGSRLGGYETPPPVNKVPAHPLDIILGRPTGTSITISMLAYADSEAQIVFGTHPDKLAPSPEIYYLAGGVPREIGLTGLRPDTHYYYRVKYWPAASASGPSESTTGKLSSFHTQRASGGGFRFTIQADSHLDENTSGAMYLRTLANALADAADFHIALGDTFMTGKYVRPELAEPQYLAQRYFLGTLCHSSPLFFCLGNHDGESGMDSPGGRRNRDSTSATRIWAANTRKKYFPNPFPDGFYTGNRDEHPGIGLAEDYYAWQWGDSLFIVLDPFWYSDTPAAGNNDFWNRSLGETQYRWLEATLEKSPARFKFVFIHHLAGGADKNGRGGIASAPFFEWGGHEMDGSDTFARHRRGWPMPIHDLLVQHHVTIVFHGHDHLYAREALDGLVYQAVPQPGHPRFGNVRSAAEYGYDGDVISSSGHLRVAVSGDSVRVDYVRACLPDDETGQRKNGDLSDSYEIRATADR